MRPHEQHTVSQCCGLKSPLYSGIRRSQEYFAGHRESIGLLFVFLSIQSIYERICRICSGQRRIGKFADWCPEEPNCGTKQVKVPESSAYDLVKDA